MTDEEREEIENNPVLTGEDELGGRIEQGMTNEEAAQLTGWDANGGDEYGDAQTDLLEDRNAIKKEQDKQFIEGGAKRTGDPLATSTGDLEGNYRQSIADASKGGTVVGTGTRLADDRSWEARYNDMMARRKAERAGLKAQSLARQELLDTGRYFDDGRGNIKLKKSEREFRRPDSTRRGWHVDTTADNGAGMRYIQKAGQDAYSGSMGGWQQALNAQNAEKQNSVRNEFEAYAARNKAAMEKREEDRELQKKRNASDNWVLTSGIFAALNDLQNGPAGTKDRITDEEVDDKSKPAKRQAITDSKGAIMGYKDVYEKKNVGKIKNGYLDPSEVDMINRQLEANGNKRWRLKGIVAQQRFDPKLGNENSDTARKGKPYVLVNIEMKDPQTGEWKPASRYMTMDTLYKFGVDNGKDSGRADAEDIIAEKLGDPNGYLKRKKEAAAHELELARIKAGEGRAAITAKGNAEVANINAQGKRDVAAAKTNGLNGQSGNGFKFDKNYAEFLEGYAAKYAPKIMDDNDNMIDNPNYDPVEYDQAMKRLRAIARGGVDVPHGAESAAGGADAAQGVATPEVQADRVAKAKEQLAKMRGGGQNGVQPQAVQGQRTPAKSVNDVRDFLIEEHTNVDGEKVKLIFDKDDREKNYVYGVVQPDGSRLLMRDPSDNNSEGDKIPEGTLAPWEKSDAKTDGAKAQGRPQINTQNVGRQSGAAIVEQFGKKGETANATSQANNEKQSGSGKEQDIDLSDVQEGIDRSAAGADDVYRTIPREIIKRVKDATGASDEEIMSGKYDRQIEALGARVGNDSVKGISDRRKATERNLEAIKGKRKAEAKQEGFRKRQMAFASARKEMEKKARDEAEKYGVAHGYDDSQIEKRAGTSIRRGLIELRDKYGLAADGSQDYMVSKK